MMMKRILALTLCLLLTLGFAACEKEDGNTDNGNKENTSSVNFYITYNGNKIELGADATALLGPLGTPISESEMGACGDMGTVTKYVYDTIELFVLKNGSKATVDQITFRSDLIKTPEGITIGSSADDVIKAIGENCAKKTDSEIRYTNGKKNIKFTLRDGSVTGVDYMVVS